MYFWYYKLTSQLYEYFFIQTMELLIFAYFSDDIFSIINTHLFDIYNFKKHLFNVHNFKKHTIYFYTLWINFVNNPARNDR